MKDKKFRQCKYLAFHISIQDIQSYDEVQSIDDMEQQDRSGEFKNLEISPEEEFWGHCSNLQAWVENSYDTRLLHSNLAFPLLKRLTEVGDPVAKKVFKNEIIYRFEEVNPKILKFLSEEGYFEYFSKEEIESLPRSLNSSLSKLTLWGIKNRAPSIFYKNLENLEKNFELAKFGVQNNVPEQFYDYFLNLMTNLELAKWAVQNKAPNYFYKNLDEFRKNIELVEKDFYKYFAILKGNAKNAKFGAQNHISIFFYELFDKIMADPELARWGVQNKIPYNFYIHFSRIQQDPFYINSFKISSEKKEDFLERFSKKDGDYL
jgi:hypothetical protein